MRTASRVRTVTGPFPVLLLMLNLLATSALCGELRVAGNPIRVGILHSLSGTMGISEAPLKDTLLMLIEQQNEAGGLLGRKLEAIVVDPASNWPLFTEGARELLELDQVDVVFGCWTSVSRKSGSGKCLSEFATGSPMEAVTMASRRPVAAASRNVATVSGGCSWIGWTLLMSAPRRRWCC